MFAQVVGGSCISRSSSSIDVIPRNDLRHCVGVKRLQSQSQLPLKTVRKSSALGGFFWVELMGIPE